MKNREIETRIRQAFQKATPDVLDSVLSDCEMQKGTVIPMTKKKNFRWTTVAALAAALALVIGLGFGTYQQNHTVISTVSLDVNPSVELELNRNERVLRATALNEDGEKILGDMDLENSDLDVAVNALIGSMLRHGYLNELANSILVSVNSQDAEKGLWLQAQLSEQVNALLHTDKFDGAVISQTVPEDQTLNDIAREYGISIGKAALIQKMIQQNSRYSFDILSRLSINELNLLSVSGKLHLEGVDSTGAASEKDYIGTEAAKLAAIEHAGVTEEQLWDLEIDLDYDAGKMVYEVEFHTADAEFEYDIDAKSGQVIKAQRDDSNKPQTPVLPDTRITPEEAKAAALSHANISAESLRDFDCELETDDGILIYDISFKTADAEFEYDIDAATGAVISYDREDFRQNPDKPQTPELPDRLSPAEAVEIALNHAGIDRAEITDMECELEENNGSAYFDISFQWGVFDYDYDIDAVSGSILECEKDRDDDVIDNDDPLPPDDSRITADQAKAIAFDHAKVSEAEVADLECELDEDGGKAVYEISFQAGSTEYDYEIDAVTGQILKSEKEHSDDYVTPLPPVDSRITADQAKAIAFDHAKISEAEVADLECELDEDGGKAVYEISFQAGSTEYDYEIDAVTGQILHHEVENDLD